MAGVVMVRQVQRLKMFHGQFFMPLICYQVVDSLVLFFVGQGFPAVKHSLVPTFFGALLVVAPLFFDIMVIMTKSKTITT